MYEHSRIDWKYAYTVYAFRVCYYDDLWSVKNERKIVASYILPFFFSLHGTGRETTLSWRLVSSLTPTMSVSRYNIRPRLKCGTLSSTRRCWKIMERMNARYCIHQPPIFTVSPPMPVFIDLFVSRKSCDLGLGGLGLI